MPRSPNDTRDRLWTFFGVVLFGSAAIAREHGGEVFDGVNHAAFSPEGKLVVTASGDGTAQGQRRGEGSPAGARASSGTGGGTWLISSGRGKPLHSTERAKQVTVHYRWHPRYGQIARVRRGVPRSTGEVLFCELADGTMGALPAWMTEPRPARP
jgi:hypothetical protein